MTHTHPLSIMAYVPEFSKHEASAVSLSIGIGSVNTWVRIDAVAARKLAAELVASADELETKQRQATLRAQIEAEVAARMAEPVMEAA